MSSKEQAHSNDKAVSKQPSPKPATEITNMLAQQQSHPAAIIQRATLDPGSLTQRDVLRLQRTVGNRVVGRLLARIGSRPTIQARLTVGAAGDRYEQEADRIADQVMRLPRPAGVQRPGVDAPPDAQRHEDEELQTKPLAASITPLAQRQADEEEEIQATPLAQRQAEEEEEEVQAKPLAQRQAEEEEKEEVQAKPGLQPRAFNPQASFEAGSEIESRLAASKGGGSPLPDEVRATMEPRFGADFSGVRLHTGGEAAQLSQDLSAQAFTHGPDIYLGAGRYSPGTSEGQRLLAHELTHVVQQGAAQVRRSESGSPSHPAVGARSQEPGADTAPTRVDEKTGASPELQGEAILQRTCKDRKQHAKSGPSNCHEFVLWTVMQEDLDMSAQEATDRLADLRLPATQPGASINPSWYGKQIVKAGTQVTEKTVKGAKVGDILVLPHPTMPMHSMLVAKQDDKGTWIRGFNNFGTLYTGVANQDDPVLRNLHGKPPDVFGANSYWKSDGQFWGGNTLYKVDRATFKTNLEAALGK
jgi:hypothetical protein